MLLRVADHQLAEGQESDHADDDFPDRPVAGCVHEKQHGDGQEQDAEPAEDDRQQLTTLSCESTTGERMRNMLQYSGIAGANLTSSPLSTFPTLKCLHTHYAHFRSTTLDDSPVFNPVGAKVHDILMDQYPALIL